MADLARLRRMAPFADLSTQQFRAVIGELKTLFEPSTSGSSLGGYSSPSTRAIRGLPGETLRAYIAVADQVGNTINIQAVDSLGQPTGGVITAIVLP